MIFRLSHIATVCCAALLFSLQPMEAMEKKIISGSGQSVRLSTVYSVYPGDSPDHEVRYTIRHDLHTSGNPDWNNAQSILYGLLDQMGTNGTHTGYQIYTHSDGDQSFTKHSGKQSLQPAGGGKMEVHFEGTFEWTGGTGKFEYMRGSGTYKGKIDVNGTATYNYEGIANY
ncbi:MAG: hypothetical protein OEV30_00285 [Ignavibacteria bacterium]|nr:hypothetical protein [Ignavibacteria bacterium]